MATKGNAENFTMVLSIGVMSPAVTLKACPRDLNILGIALSSSGDVAGVIQVSLNPTAAQTTGVLALLAQGNAVGGGSIFIPLKLFLQQGRVIYLYDSGGSAIVSALIICEAA